MTCDMLISSSIQLLQQRTLMKLMQPPTFHRGQGRNPTIGQPELIIDNEKLTLNDDENNDDDDENDANELIMI